jgi:hypothetical protein
VKIEKWKEKTRIKKNGNGNEDWRLKIEKLKMKAWKEN